MKKTILIIFLWGTMLIAGAQVPSYIPNDSLIGWWPFNGNANDLSGKGNNGAVIGAALTTDRFGTNNSAFHFNSAIIVLPISSISFEGDFTISIWVNIDTFSSQYPTFINGVWEDDITLMSFIVCQFEVKPPSPIVVSFLFTDRQYYDGVKGGVISAKNWMNIVIKDSARYAMLYINGNFIRKQAKPSVIQGTVSGNYLKIGDGRHSYGGAFIGKIDDIGIWNRALDAKEIKSIYNGSTASVKNDNSNSIIKVYPNPAEDHIIIDFGSYSSMLGYSITIFDVAGKSVYNSTINKVTETIDLNTWTGKGVYFIKIYDKQSQQIENRKIIIQ